AVPVHADAEGTGAAQGQPGVEGPGYRTHGVLVVLEILVQVPALHDQRTADDVGVPTEVLGRRVQDDVGAQRQRLLEVGAGEGVVHHQQRATVVGELGQRGDVGDVEQRVGRRLDPDDPGVVPRHRPGAVDVGQVRHVEPQAPALGDAGE